MDFDMLHNVIIDITLLGLFYLGVYTLGYKFLEIIVNARIGGRIETVKKEINGKVVYENTCSNCKRSWIHKPIQERVVRKKTNSQKGL